MQLRILGLLNNHTDMQLRILLKLGLMCRYRTPSKDRSKYVRDVEFERGMINILFRETNRKCMNEAKVYRKNNG